MLCVLAISIQCVLAIFIWCVLAIFAGMTWTSDLRELVWQYVFFGTYCMKIHSQSTKFKSYPIIRAIHLNVTNQRRRFVSNADPAYKELFELMMEDDFDMDILTDEGKGSATPKLMAAVENGTRELAQRCVHTMGALAGKSAEAYVRAKTDTLACVLAIS